MNTLREYARKLLSIFKSPALGKIWRSTKGERRRLALLSVLYAFGALISLGFTMIMRELVDAAVSGNANRLKLYALALACVICVMLGAGYWRRILSEKIRLHLLHTMRAEALHNLLRKQFIGLRRYHSGELVNRVFSDVSIVTNGIIDIVPPLLYLLVQLAGASILLYRMNSAFMLILMLTGIGGAGAAFLFRDKMKGFHKASQSAEDHLHARIQETLENLRIIKASGTEARMEREADASHERYIDARMRSSRFSAFMSVALGLIFRGSWFYALLWGCRGIFQGTLTYGTLTAILQLVGQIQSPFEGLIATVGSAYGTTSSAERLMELYALADDAPELTEKNVPPDFQTLRMEDIHFSYEEDIEILRGIELTVNRGDTMAIMGASGCGKSTLFLVLLGIYLPTAGRLCTDEKQGIPRALFSYVPQGNALFSGTLRENLTLFCTEMPEERMLWQAAENACIADYIRSLPNGLDTVIGEHALGLSEGQAQRIAIARALMTKAPVLLLDEATSALDEATEAAVLRNIAALKDRTCLIVTHRRAALEICNRVIRFEDGRIEEKYAD